jgi:hypothetical protein
LIGHTGGGAMTPFLLMSLTRRNEMSRFRSGDTPAMIAGKYLAGRLPDVSAAEAMHEIRKRSIALEGQRDTVRAELARLKGRRRLKVVS